ncbi:MAG: L-threonylcarbamoyladenylate synthase [Halobacteriales archaeon]
MEVDEAADVLEDGGVVVYPTETVYGLAASVDRREAVDRVYEVKRRPRSKPLSVAFESVEAALDRTKPSDRALSLMERLLPGPVTVVVENAGVPSYVVSGLDAVGVRVPGHPDARELARLAGPITSTSANVSGEDDARSPDELEPGVVDAVDGVVEARRGPREGSGRASTVVDAVEWQVVRRGAEYDVVRRTMDELSRTGR